MLQLTNQLIALGYASPGWSYAVGEHHIYGSSRLGIHQTKKELRNRYKQEEIFIPSNTVNTTALYRGKRNYELSNHLGNFNGCWFCEARPYRHESRERSASGVNVVLSDKRKSVCDEELGVEYFVAEVLSAVDYYPFGMVITDRQWYAGNDSSIAVNGFNGQEKDDEVSGVGNSMTAEFWQYDARLGRRWNTDPVVKEWESPYATFHNSPIFYSDAKGDDPEPKKKERSVRKYERKFNRLAKKHSDWTNDQLHDEMERRHNGKRWMWVQAETGSNVSGDGQDHGRYYHAGDLFQDAHPEHARTPPPAPATPPTPLVANNWVLNGPPVVIGNAYFIPASGTVTLTLNVTGAATNTGVFTVSQGNNPTPTPADIANVIGGPITVNPGVSPQTVTLNVNVTAGNMLYVQTTFTGTPPAGGGIIGTTTATLTPTPTAPVISKPDFIQVISQDGVRNPHKLTRSTRKALQDELKRKRLR